MFHHSLALVISLLGCSLLHAQYKSEHRVFKITIEGTEAGTYTQTITTYGEGTTDFVGRSDVKFKVLGFTYQQAFRGQERWKEGKLLHLSSASNDNGDPHTLVVNAAGDQLKVLEGGKERMIRGDVWSTSYWTLPPMEQRKGTVPLIDSDLGTEHQVKLQHMGKVVLIVNSQRVTCNHYKVTGPVQADLWFDENERLVRRDMERRGRKVTMMLVSTTIK
jgi:hypothetical protein